MPPTLAPPPLEEGGARLIEGVEMHHVTPHPQPRSCKSGAGRYCVPLPQCLARSLAAPPLPPSGGRVGRGPLSNAACVTCADVIAREWRHPAQRGAARPKQSPASAVARLRTDELAVRSASVLSPPALRPLAREQGATAFRSPNASPAISRLPRSRREVGEWAGG